MRETRGFKIYRGAVLGVLGLFVLIPLYVMVTSSLKPLKDVQGAFTWWPSNLTLAPFVDMWKTVPLARYFVNSTIVSVAATVFSVAIAILAAFAVSRFRFRGRTVFTTTVLSTQMFPGVLFLLPLFLIFVNINNELGLQLVGTRLGLIITYLTFSLPFSIWMLAGYFDSIPRELDEAALVDGCGPMGALCRPGTVPIRLRQSRSRAGRRRRRLHPRGALPPVQERPPGRALPGRDPAVPLRPRLSPATQGHRQVVGDYPG